MQSSAEISALLRPQPSIGADRPRHRPQPLQEVLVPLTEHQAQRRRLRFLGLVALAHRHIAYQRATPSTAVATIMPPDTARAGKARLGMLGGGRDADGAFTFTWPIWRKPSRQAQLRAYRKLVNHPRDLWRPRGLHFF